MLNPILQRRARNQKPIKFKTILDLITTSQDKFGSGTKLEFFRSQRQNSIAITRKLTMDLIVPRWDFCTSRFYYFGSAFY